MARCDHTPGSGVRFGSNLAVGLMIRWRPVSAADPPLNPRIRRPLFQGELPRLSSSRSIAFQELDRKCMIGLVRHTHQIHSTHCPRRWTLGHFREYPLGLRNKLQTRTDRAHHPQVRARCTWIDNSYERSLRKEQRVVGPERPDCIHQRSPGDIRE
jgi:hypothetical protein